MSLENQILTLIEHIGHGKMSSTAYDTSWFVRLRKNGKKNYPQTLQWLLTHQHPDGSWGGVFETFHDRLISTLACVNALTLTDSDVYDRQIKSGIHYIRSNAHRLHTDSYETIGFELLFPMLLDEAETLGLDVPLNAFNHVRDNRDKKLKLLPAGWVYQPHNPMAHNLEYMANELDSNAAESLVDAFGSVANSPSATAYYFMRRENRAMRAYLDLVMEQSEDGGVCNVLPFEVFEISWVYYNLLLADVPRNNMSAGVSYLQKAWTKDGIGISMYGLMPDADDSALAMSVLRKAGVEISHKFLEKYRTEQGYLCFPFERNPSVSTNIHILDALAGDKSHDGLEIKRHILRFLRATRIDERYWKDKWHVSPYYTTCHAVIALKDIDKSLAQAAIQWLQETQRTDGSWGIFSGTVEETAYCVQALLLYDASNQNHDVNMNGAIDYLKANRNQSHYPELWIGKGLYAPINVIKSSALSALLLHAKSRGVLS